MNLLDWVKESATVIGAFAVLLGLLALLLLFVGVTNPVLAALSMIAYVALAVLIIFGVGFGVMIGRDLWETKASWKKKAVGGVLLVVSTALGIAVVIYVSGNIGMSDCPAGLPFRYC